MDQMNTARTHRALFTVWPQIACGAVVNAAGPWVGHVHEVLAPLAPRLPVRNEIHGKVILKDVLRLVCGPAIRVY
jgi:glycerol-3-phosphate dehydrogenase